MKVKFQRGQGNNQRGAAMHEVRVYDSSGDLKKVISVKALSKRSDKQLEFPDLFVKNKRGIRSRVSPPKVRTKSKTSQFKSLRKS